METATNVYYVIAAGFIVYFFISYAYKILKIRNIEEALLTSRGLLLINLKHTIGIVLFGLTFYLIAPEFRFLINTFQQPEWNVVILSLVVLVLSALLAYISVQKKIKEKTERSAHSFHQVWNYFPIRMLFLFSYEFFFRGVIFFSLLQFFDLYMSILITTILYLLIHSFDSKAEILGAIPFGILLCFFSYATNSIWIAFVIHMTLSGVYEFIMFKHLTLKTAKS
jgi:membrane protease YdiL (CAAX protease family)